MSISTPLVTVAIYNFNYGRYLSECFDSVLSQTYKNIEILFSDNASSDNSWEIALEYQRKYPDKIFVARNQKNFGTDANLRNCLANRRGKYYVVLGSDDVLRKTYVEATVTHLESHQDVAFVMTHRYIIDSLGNSQEEEPFYDGSYKLFPPSQAGVYFMAAVNPSISQIMYKGDCTIGRGASGSFAAQYYGTRIMDFRISLEFPIIYLRDALIGHRIHGENQSLEADKYLMEVIGPYVLNLQFKEMARPYKFDVIEKKFALSFEKLSHLSLRYAARSALNGNYDLAKKYFYLSAAIFPLIEINQEFLMFKNFFSNDNNEESLKKLTFNKSVEFNRNISYKPDMPYEAI